ncbi:hypothetical protein SAMN05428642_102107 [Flaviramulus basaltis]|uniref:DUF4394 domain-containing protein n=1 Tax=Flaviramulus basaltis TaxID=369401 RepID=A0A1K2IGE7_9FLAO|nr:hypothetical protein [Flaviramulus basaltis]SFZ91508.1 hypothetical protein SAMN05428642_102107 [Flaviramulus basaltis]
MKRLNLIKSLALLALINLAFTSCSDDDSTGMDASLSTYLFASNNSDGNVTTYNVSSISNVTSKTLITPSTAADGIYYDKNNDVVVQASRSNFSLEGYSNVALSMAGSSISVGVSGSTDMTSPRELAVNGNFYVVVDNSDPDGDTNTPDGRLFIYSKSGNSFTLRNVITTDFKLWGITFDGEDLYAIVDTTNQLAVYTNFLSNMADATLSASKTIVVEGIVRTHGLTYDAMSDTMVLTDIASAMNGQDDGGFHIIEGFTSKFNNTANGGTLALSQQTRVAGSSTLLGNPVDVAYDSATKTVFIAEAGNGGGRILAFNNIGSGGNIAPVVNNDLASASSVFLSKY